MRPRFDPALLNSWKEIATYMGRSVRTVQRWEQFGLPVRRLSPSPKSAVIARREEIDIWLRAARRHGFSIKQSEEHIFLRSSLAETVEISRALRAEMAQLREERRNEMLALTETLAQLVRSLEGKETFSLPTEQKARTELKKQ